MKNLPPYAIGLALSAALLLAACTSSTETEPGSEQAPGQAAPGAGGQEPQADAIRQAQEVEALRVQKTELLVEDRLRRAQAAFADGRLSEAEDELLDANLLDPGNTDVLSLWEQVQLAMGKPFTPLTGSAEDVRLQQQARLERIKAETESSAERGFRMLGEGELDEAIGSLRLAQANILGTPYEVNWGDLPGRVSEALARAEQELAVSKAAQRDEEKRETFESLQQQEELARAQRQARLDAMLTEAIRAFDEEDFDRAADLSEEILRQDPLNERASELKDASNRVRHDRVSESFMEERGERFRRWSQEIARARIPYSDILQTPDPDYWARISELRKDYRELGLAEEVDETSLALQQELSTTMIPGLQVAGETSLEEVINQLRTYTDIPFVVTPDAVEAVDAEGVEFNLNLAHRISVENALKVITAAAGPTVTYSLKNGVVYISSAAKAQGQLVLKGHDVQDLTAQVTDFSGPKIADIRLPDQTPTGVDEEEPVFGGAFGDLRAIMNPDNLEQLIRQSIAPTTWEEMEGVSIRYQNGFLIVVHTHEVQRQIDAFLQDLRRYVSSMVTIEARFLTIQKDFLQEMGVDWRGLGGTFSPPTSLVNLDDITSGLEDNASRGLDNSGSGAPDTNPSAGLFFDDFGDGDLRARSENILGAYGDRLTPEGGLTMGFTFLDDTQYAFILRAVEKSNRAQELTSSTVSVQNTMRSFITVLNQVTYVQDMDVEVAQAALIADPQVGVLSDGIVLDVRPTISHDRKYITLELRPTVATLLRPIPEFTSSLAGLTTPVTLQLPELQVSSANTTVRVPDGGIVVIGGLKKLLDIEQRAEIPLLAKIPVLSILFKTEGEAHENQDVIILIRAHITDAQEVMGRMDSVMNN
ncbi:MAG: hypothetical protein EYC70_14545 [Planctomycetota bacterium]|nr:MAG: hypothetical protein EYC70_14545 [Planctomycetota bacterium]